MNTLSVNSNMPYPPLLGWDKLSECDITSMSRISQSLMNKGQPFIIRVENLRYVIYTPSRNYVYDPHIKIIGKGEDMQLPTLTSRLQSHMGANSALFFLIQPYGEVQDNQLLLSSLYYDTSVSHEISLAMQERAVATLN